MSAMPPEWSASSLLARFAVRGHFYEREAGGALLKLRDRLEIFDKALPWDAVRDGNAGLVAVMMNPGASRPLTEADADGWCDAVPDRTQYQLMRLTLAAAALGAPRIRHIRVINLSDLRTPAGTASFTPRATTNCSAPLATPPHPPLLYYAPGAWQNNCAHSPSRRWAHYATAPPSASPTTAPPTATPCPNAPTCNSSGYNTWRGRW